MIRAAMIQPRKVAAIDLALLGPVLILIEFAVGVLLSAGLGVFVIWRARSVLQIVFGFYLVSIALNYSAASRNQYQEPGARPGRTEGRTQ
jgi:multisubunit Na+/H+ antiporter MnhC subunit